MFFGRIIRKKQASIIHDLRRKEHAKDNVPHLDDIPNPVSALKVDEESTDASDNGVSYDYNAFSVARSTILRPIYVFLCLLLSPLMIISLGYFKVNLPVATYVTKLKPQGNDEVEMGQQKMVRFLRVNLHIKNWYFLGKADTSSSKIHIILEFSHTAIDSNIIKTLSFMYVHSLNIVIS